MLFKNSKRKRGSILTCEDCQSKVKCDACKTSFPKDYWSVNERNNKQKRDSRLVCKTCREKGCTAHDVALYTCTKCEQQLGTARFDKTLLEDNKYHGYQNLRCKACTAKETAKIRDLQKALQKSKVRCKCFRPLHTERCPLSSCYYGQRKWPGCDDCISYHDRQFLDELNPRPAWWSAAWGKKTENERKM